MSDNAEYNSNNPSKRFPVILILDASKSMEGLPIKELNKGILQFFHEIQNDNEFRNMIELCIISFGKSVDLIENFVSIDSAQPPQLVAGGGTPMGEAVELALKKIEERKFIYSENGASYYQPCIVLMTDGSPTDDITNSATLTNQMISNKKLSVILVAIGPLADEIMLSQFSKKDLIHKIGNDFNFTSFFKLLSSSIQMSVAKKTDVSMMSAALPEDD